MISISLGGASTTGVDILRRIRAMEKDKVYRRRFARKWTKHKRSLDVMGITLEEAVDIEMWLAHKSLKYPKIEPKH